ncbi:uncharacterized protein LOC133823146 [Humulus lupulus]|uniref:uncharacterized protein LOC133823146 n=1 Tax=Humulus lupulus TaxID=3486 RepID=UPI002B40B10D|nr:uncharacterized protein LOC133823146 [Humulus lupulus]
MQGGVKRDRWGYDVRSSSDACISAINDYYDQVLIYGRERSVILKATLHDRDCVLANILVAHYLSSSDPSQALFYLHAAASRLEQATSYEKAVFDAVNSLISENRDDDVALEMHFKLLDDFPKDLASLKRAQVICFYMGRADLSLTLVQQVLPQNQLENYIYGLLAFPLLELGQMEEAEKAARKALEINKVDCWAQHNFCHVLQYECRFKEAVQFMEDCSSSWASLSSFMITHNWWHVALCYMEGHSAIERIVEVYDQHIWKELERADASVPEVYLNAVGLLLRVHVRGEIDVFRDHLKSLASCLTDQRNWFMEWHFDVLILWALAYSNELSKAEDLLKGLRSRFLKMNSKKQQLMQRGMWLAEAMYEYGKGNYKQALDFLEPDFDAVDYKIIGASDEQVDVFNEVWYSMLLNTGQALKVIEVLGARIKKRQGVPFLWRLLERAYTIVGSKEATIVGEKAKVLETAYFK